MVCWDVHFLEVARNLSNNGAEVITMPIWGGNPALAKARAIENQVFVMAPAQCGQHSPDRSSYGRSMIVDPPSGRAPLRASAIASRNQNLVNLTDGWLTHTPWERCSTRGIPGGMFPGGYGAGYQILQVPGYVVIFYEMIHEARIIPIDDRAPLSDKIRLWNGDARGRWEGDTLVVETVNFNDRTWIDRRGVPHSDQLRVVERIRRSNEDELTVDITVADPIAFTELWTSRKIFDKVDWSLEEFVCLDDSSYQEFERALLEYDGGSPKE